MTELYYFNAPWCTQCKTFKPMLEDVLKDYENVTLIQLNMDEDETLTMGRKYGILSIPAVAIGEEVLVNPNETLLRNFLEDNA